jgi:hypothetical protein
VAAFGVLEVVGLVVEEEAPDEEGVDDELPPLLLAPAPTAVAFLAPQLKLKQKFWPAKSLG